MSQAESLSDGDFLQALRAAVDRYLAAVDQWESAYQKYYRLPGYASKVSDDLAAEEREYHLRRRDLETLLPRARRLCLKYQMENPFPGLVRITLGRFAPQHRRDSAIGRNERSRVAKCLLELTDACREWERQGGDVEHATRQKRGSLIERVVNYFF